MPEDALVALAKERCISLTTFKRDGRAVSTPVWFALDSGRLLVWTGAETGKARRIRHDPRVTVAACTMRGVVTGAVLPATARILSPEEGPGVQALLNRKYGVQKRLLDLYNAAMRRVRRREPGRSVYLEITLTQSE